MLRVSRKRLLDKRRFRLEISESNVPIETFRITLAEARNKLRFFHKSGVTAHEILSANSWLIDQILTAAWNYLVSPEMDSKRSALVAVGGYGRTELHPHSDIYLLILFSSDPNSIEKLFCEKSTNLSESG